MPWLELISSSAESFCGDFRSISTPSAISGRCGLTWAVQAVV